MIKKIAGKPGEDRAYALKDFEQENVKGSRKV